MEVDVNTPAGWVIKLKEPGPSRPGEGGVQMGRSSSLQGLGPLETTLPLHYQVIPLTHFTGGEAHRLPHLTVTSLWERAKGGNEEPHGEGEHGGIFFSEYLSHHEMHLVIRPHTLT